MMTPHQVRLHSRLNNWKFAQAVAVLNEPHQYVDDTVLPWFDEQIRALAAIFGDVGWFDGAMGTIVQSAVAFLCKELEGGK